MPDPINPAANPNPADAKPVPDILKDAGAPAAAPDILDDAAKQAQAAVATEEKRLLEADPKTLSAEDQTKRIGIEKTREEKRLLETPEDKLNDADKVKKAELVKTKEVEAKSKVVPEKYEIKVPEGMTLDQAFLDKVTPVFKKHNVTQAAAQEIADIYIANMKAQADAAAAEFKKFQEDSYKETIAALGADYKEKLVFVAKVRDRLLSPESRELISASGLSNNKSFITDLIEIGKLISEDKLPPVKPAIPGAGKDAASIMYPQQPK